MATSKGEAVILGLLSQLQGATGRTKLVKLVYLVDNLWAEHSGESLTGYRYHWDNYGPNAVGNEIVATLDGLNDSGLLRSSQGSTPYGNPAYYYRASQACDPAQLPLSSDEWMFIQSITKRFGKLNREYVVKVAKATLPMKNATQGDVLVLEANPDIEATRKSVLSNADLMAQVNEALLSDHLGIPLEELKASYAQ